MIEFEKVEGTDNHCRILFELLKERKYNISHNKLPDFQDHKRFVYNHPYISWFIVKRNSEFLGSFYIKSDNSIGLNLIVHSQEIVEKIIDYIKNNFKPSKAFPSLVPSYFYLNISSQNFELKAILEKMKINTLQVSYKI